MIGSWLLGGSIILVAAVAALLSMPSPDLEWQTVVLPSAVEYMEKSMGVEFEENGTSAVLLDHLPLQGMIIAVTGATSGIGLGLTRKLSLLGATVVAIGRSPQKLKQLQEELPDNVETVLADFSDLDSIAEASKYMLEHYDHLDILVNNAGIHTGFEGIIKTWVTKQGYDLPFSVNYLSHFLLTERLMPLLKASKSPKVVQISSRFHLSVDGSDLSTNAGTKDPIASQEGGSHGFFFFRSQRQYANSKFAQILHARSLRNHHQIRAISVCPSWVGTHIGANNGETFQKFFERTAFPMDGFGLSSTLHAILDTNNDGDADLYVNSFGNNGFNNNALLDNLPAWTYQSLPIRDSMVGGAAFTFVFILQKFVATREVARSSLQTYDPVLQEELYAWSRQAVSQWL